MRKRKNSIFILAAITMASLSSCNRGVGCPSNFSLDAGMIESATTAISSFLSLLI